MNSAQLTGNIGLFYACYQLSLRDWNALPTCRNAKGADIICVKGKKRFGIQVKALSSQSDVPLGRGELDESVDFWAVIMNVRDDEKRKVFIIPQEDIRCEIQKYMQDNINDLTGLIGRDKAGFWMGNKFLRTGQHNYADAWQCLEEE